MTYNKKSIEDIEIKAGQKVFVRCDFNVPMKDGVITSDKRIVGALPTIKYLMSKGAKVILSSHMGKPHAIFSANFKLDKKEQKKVDAMPEAEREAATAELKKKALEGDGKKFTRVVIEGELNGITYYYPIAVPELERNNCYSLDITIKRPGSLDPDSDVEKGTLLATVSVLDWDIADNNVVEF